jgi:hypothetical protein
MGWTRGYRPVSPDRLPGQLSPMRVRLRFLGRVTEHIVEKAQETVEAL